MVLSIVGLDLRSFSTKVLLVGAASTSILFLYVYSSPSAFSSILASKPKFAFETSPGTCPPRAYSNGRWTGPHYRTDARKMSNKSQAVEFAGFEGCASSREFDWHLASDTEDQWDRFPDAQSYKWTVGKADGCEGLLELDKEQMVRDLVEQGGWLMLGDSITEGHFFSLSCVLYPHVIATPIYTPNSYFDRAWPQNLYLNPESPLLRPSSGTHKQLVLPPGFNVTGTPLATFRRVDLLLTQEELKELHQTVHPRTRPDFELFSNESAWSLSPTQEYLPIFFKGNYSTMVISTAGHWTTTLFGGYGANQTAAFEGAKLGIDGVIDFFGHAMEHWADQVQSRLRVASKADGGARKRQVVVRAYLPGHEDCHSAREPWTRVLPMKWNWYNWGRIWEFNDVFEKVLMKDAKRYPDIHYLAIDRPGRLRPDAHATGDCLHIMGGAGVMEGWSHYIWHYVSRELGRSRHSRIKVSP